MSCRAVLSMESFITSSRPLWSCFKVAIFYLKVLPFHSCLDVDVAQYDWNSPGLAVKSAKMIENTENRSVFIDLPFVCTNSLQWIWQKVTVNHSMELNIDTSPQGVTLNCWFQQKNQWFPPQRRAEIVSLRSSQIDINCLWPTTK